MVGALITKLSPKLMFIIGYILTALGGAALIFTQNPENGGADASVALIAAFVLFAKFGASMAMCTCYISTPFLFPVLLCGTAFGICNLIGRTTALSASVIVELAIPLPMEIFTGIAVASILVAFMLQSNVE